MISVQIKYLFTNIKKSLTLLPKREAQKQVQFFFPLGPRQHPKHSLSQNLSILSPRKSIRMINSSQDIPKPLYVDSTRLVDFQTELSQEQVLAQEFFMKGKSKQPNPTDQMFLQVVIVGPPNAGKSTFMNRMVEEEVSAVSDKSNTTNRTIVGIHTNYDRRVQIEFKDTPGITKRYQASKQFVSRAWDEISQSDMIMFMVDGVKTLEDSVKEAIKRLNGMKMQEKVERYSDEDLVQQLQIIKNKIKFVEEERPLKEQPYKKILVINKMDLCFNKKKLRWLLTEFEDLARFDKVFFISSLTGHGMDELKTYLYENSIQTQWKYERYISTTLHPIEQIEQVVRSALFKRFYHEIPFQVSIQVTGTKYPLSLQEFRVFNDGSAKFQFVLGAQNESQAKMLIGESGRNLKVMSNEIQLQIAKTYQKPVQVNMQVLVRQGDYQKFIEEDMKNEFTQVLQGQSEVRTSLQNENKLLKSRREDIAKAFQEYIRL